MTFKFQCGDFVQHVCDVGNAEKFRELLVLARAENICGSLEYLCRNGVSAPHWFSEKELVSLTTEVRDA